MRPVEQFSADRTLPAALAATMGAASDRQWLVMLSDGSRFYLGDEERAQRFAQKNEGAKIFAPIA